MLAELAVDESPGSGQAGGEGVGDPAERGG